MKRMTGWGITVFILAGLTNASLPAQTPQPGAAPDPGYAPNTPPPPSGGLSTAILEWTPPALATLSAQATAKSSFTLDRTMLAAAASLMSNPDDETKQAIAKLDGVSVHVLNFAAPGMADPAQVDAIRQAYHLRGWKHLMSTDSTGGPIHSGKADVWMVLDGTNVRGAVVLVQGQKSLALVTLAGNLSPVDLMHLRGHFGIPRFEGDRLKDSEVN
jgi:hypothetical protein